MNKHLTEKTFIISLIFVWQWGWGTSFRTRDGRADKLTNWLEPRLTKAELSQKAKIWFCLSWVEPKGSNLILPERSHKPKYHKAIGWATLSQLKNITFSCSILLSVDWVCKPKSVILLIFRTHAKDIHTRPSSHQYEQSSSLTILQHHLTCLALSWTG